MVVTIRLCDNIIECFPIKPTFTRDKVLVREVVVTITQPI